MDIRGVSASGKLKVTRDMYELWCCGSVSKNRIAALIYAWILMFRCRYAILMKHNLNTTVTDAMRIKIGEIIVNVHTKKRPT